MVRRKQEEVTIAQASENKRHQDGAEFLKWLKGEMTKRGWSIARFARVVGINDSTVRAWLKYNRTPHQWMMLKVREVMENI